MGEWPFGERQRKATTVNHVDLIRNDWANLQQVFMGRVTAVDDLLKVNCVHPEVSQQVEDTINRSVSREAEGDVRLSELTGAMDGSYVFATIPHRDDDCAFQVERDGIGGREDAPLRMRVLATHPDGTPRGE